MKGCPIAGGDLIVDEYGKPIPWVGLYIAGASLICAFAMATDAFLAFHGRKFWFPCRFFSLNAVTLTFLSIATKLPVDLNTSMPQVTDQLTKLSGTVLLCTATGNFLPSLGAMGSTIFSNVLALAILVFTIIANIIIQISTGVIYVFIPEHLVIIVLLILLLFVFVSSAIAIPAAKENLEGAFELKSQGNSEESISLDRLRLIVKKFWLMAHSASPQYVLGRSVISSASGLFCVVAGGVLIEALLRGLVWKKSLKLCRGTSDYSWSTTAILVTQCAAISIGTIAPAIRGLSAVCLRRWNWEESFEVEDHWIQLLVNWRESPLKVEHHKDLMKILYQMKILTTDVLIFLQKVVVLFSKAGRLVSIFPLSFIVNYFFITPNEYEGAENLDEYVLLLKGEEEFARLITQSGRRDIGRWIQKGERKKPSAMEYLINNHSTYEQGFTEVGAFLPATASENCWALPLVTLAAIAAALFPDRDAGIESLLRAVGEGLRYVRLVDKHLDGRGLVNTMKAADMVWMDVRLHQKWLDEDLRKIVGERSVMEVLQRLERKAIQVSTGYTREGGRAYLEWPEKVAAADCMKTTYARILQDAGDDGVSFQRMSEVVADILGACLRSLPRALLQVCVCCKVEVRENRDMDAVIILGEAQGLLDLIKNSPVDECFSPEDRVYIDKWTNHRPPAESRDLASSVQDTVIPSQTTAVSDEV